MQPRQMPQKDSPCPGISGLLENVLDRLREYPTSAGRAQDQCSAFARQLVAHHQERPPGGGHPVEPPRPVTRGLEAQLERPLRSPCRENPEGRHVLPELGILVLKLVIAPKLLAQAVADLVELHRAGVLIRSLRPLRPAIEAAA